MATALSHRAWRPPTARSTATSRVSGCRLSTGVGGFSRCRLLSSSAGTQVGTGSLTRDGPRSLALPAAWGSLGAPSSTLHVAPVAGQAGLVTRHTPDTAAARIYSQGCGRVNFCHRTQAVASRDHNEPDEDQQAAINARDRMVEVVAGPGSGKTTLLVNKILQLVEAGAPVDSIMLLTFTNKAASELKERLRGHLSNAQLQELTAGTFHSVCFQILLCAPPSPL
jgi:hypothetical protein